jgi:GAF domain-containing protein
VEEGAKWRVLLPAARADEPYMTWEEQLQRAFEAATGRLKDDISREVQAVARDLVTELRRERETGAPAGRSSASAQPGPPVATRLLEAARALDQAGSLSEVLDRLVASAAVEASRVGLVLAVGDELRGWRFVGFAADDQPSSVAMPGTDGGVLSVAVRMGASTAVDPASPRLSPPAFAAPGGASGVAVPVSIGGEVVAVLYADQDGDESRASTSAWPDALELLARHAARCLEAKTALNAVHVLAERPQSQPLRSEPPRSLQAVPTPLRPVETPSDEDESALRYARLLVSEIKLYNETAVAAGQRDGDLTAHVGGEIARARLLYEERVPQKIRARRDYFRDELVRTLANGDARLLAVSPVLGLRS